MDVDLSLRDIKFLRAVRDISGNPEAYEKTEVGKAPANKRSITLATELGKNEVGYRLGGNHSRGLEDGDEPLIKTFEPEVVEDSNRFGPRSAELTEHGVELLSEFEESGVVGGGEREDEPETIKQLRARVEQLENENGGGQVNAEIGERLNKIESHLRSLEQSEWGAIDEQHYDDLEKTVDRLPAMYYLLAVVFDLDVDTIGDQAPLSEPEIAEVRASVREVFGIDEDRSGGDRGQREVSGGTESDRDITPPSTTREADSPSGSPN